MSTPSDLDLKLNSVVPSSEPKISLPQVYYSWNQCESTPGDLVLNLYLFIPSSEPHNKSTPGILVLNLM